MPINQYWSLCSIHLRKNLSGHKIHLILGSGTTLLQYVTIIGILLISIIYWTTHWNALYTVIMINFSYKNHCEMHYQSEANSVWHSEHHIKGLNLLNGKNDRLTTCAVIHNIYITDNSCRSYLMNCRINTNVCCLSNLSCFSS